MKIIICKAAGGDLRLPGPGLTFPRTLEPELQPGPGQELARFMFITTIFTIFGNSPSEEIPTFFMNPFPFLIGT